jgi:hypothetical protein
VAHQRAKVDVGELRSLLGIRSAAGPRQIDLARPGAPWRVARVFDVMSPPRAKEDSGEDFPALSERRARVGSEAFPRAIGNVAVVVTISRSTPRRR